MAFSSQNPLKNIYIKLFAQDKQNAIAYKWLLSICIIILTFSLQMANMFVINATSRKNML